MSLFLLVVGELHVTKSVEVYAVHFLFPLGSVTKRSSYECHMPVMCGDRFVESSH